MARYRKVSLGSNVDESLFGARTKSSDRSISGNAAVVISADELARIRSRAAMVDRLDEAAEARELREARDVRARERKEHMRRLEAEQSNPAYERSDMETANMARDQAVRKRADELLDENSDAVKLLSSLASRAIAFTVRDKQLEEKHRRAAVEGEYDRRMDMIMELDRLRDLRRREDLEHAKASKRVEDRRTITEQMEEKSHARLLEQEQKEQENASMRSLMQRYEREEEEAGARKKELVERSKREIIAANDDAIRRKRESREREKKEVEEALLYMALKDQELAKREREELEREGRKKEAQAKLLAQQERAQNNAGKLDELRARRAEEEKERQARRRERADAVKRRDETTELLRSRAEQAQLKSEQREMERTQLQADHERKMLFELRLAEREQNEMASKNASNTKHRKDLEDQIRSERDRVHRYCKVCYVMCFCG